MANEKETNEKEVVVTNLDLYQKVRQVPEEAQKEIRGGRLKGMTDINPMWRIKTLTEQFGVCGFGWYIDVLERWIETPMSAGSEQVANVKIALYVKVNDEWSRPIIGVGGAMFVAREKSGVYVDDECFKKAYTDAISVACKALGIGADVYWSGDRTKYSTNEAEQDDDVVFKVDYKSLLAEAKAQMDKQVTAEAIRAIYKDYAHHLDKNTANELAQYGKTRVEALG